MNNIIYLNDHKKDVPNKINVSKELGINVKAFTKKVADMPLQIPICPLTKIEYLKKGLNKTEMAFLIWNLYDEFINKY